MERALEKEIVVSEGQRPIWQTIIAALLYTLSFGLLFMFAKFIYNNYQTPKNIKGAFGFLKLSIFSFMGALKLSVVKTLFIDFEKEKLKTEYRVGIFSVKYFSEIPKLEYVSVFRHYIESNESTVFEVNLWYKGNKHFNVSNFEEFQPAMNFGLMFSNKLNIDLLDATEKGNSKWVEKTNS